MLSESAMICYHLIHILSSASDCFLSEAIPSVRLLHKAPRPRSECVNDKVAVVHVLASTEHSLLVTKVCCLFSTDYLHRSL